MAKRYFSASVDQATSDVLNGKDCDDGNFEFNFNSKPIVAGNQNANYPKIDGIATTFQQKKIHKRRRQREFVADHSKRAALLLSEESGLIEADDGEIPCTLTQREISNSVDVASASKHFSLDLRQFGPYCIDYTRNGRFLLLGGKRGHVAAVDWLTKGLLCEINVMDPVTDVKWLHNELMYAVAQKKFTFLYDSHGTELHCLKMLHNVLRLDFLPYHFILAASSTTSFLHWVDVSIGKLVASFPTRAGPLSVMCQNPANGLLHCGQSLGVVSLWSPNVKEPLVKLSCHRAPLKSLCVDNSGNYMATSAGDRMVKIWDLRCFKSLYEYKFIRSVAQLAFSQNKMLACSVGSDIQIFSDACYKQTETPYLMHKLNDVTRELQFCPFEDVLGVGHSSGFTSLLVPGCGEPNFDAYEANPYQSKGHRRETEVKNLLDKIQPEMISLDTTLISRVDEGAVEDVLKQKLEILYKSRLTNSDIHVKHKAKGKSSSANVQKRRQTVRTVRQQLLLDEKRKTKLELCEAGILSSDTSKIKNNSDDFLNSSVLNRFKKRKL